MKFSNKQNNPTAQALAEKLNNTNRLVVELEETLRKERLSKGAEGNKDAENRAKIDQLSLGKESITLKTGQFKQ